MGFVLSVLLNLFHLPQHGVAVAHLALERGYLQRKPKPHRFRPLLGEPAYSMLDLVALGRIDGIGRASNASKLGWAEPGLHAVAADHLGECADLAARLLVELTYLAGRAGDGVTDQDGWRIGPRSTSAALATIEPVGWL